MPAETNVKRGSNVTSMPLKALGLMSGTSVDGIDAAIIQTDGTDKIKILSHTNAPYPSDLRDKIKSVLGRQDYNDQVLNIEKEMTLEHEKIVRKITDQSGIKPDIIGFHGQTLFHDPDNHTTFQIGDGKLLAEQTGIKVVNNFRQADMKAGGQGAPFLPLYHQALIRNAHADLPAAIVNLGGVGNITWIGAEKDHLLAFDTGPANALIDDWVNLKAGLDFDKDGKMAAKGQADLSRVLQWLEDPFFHKSPPKSLDRDHWTGCDVSDLGPEDGAATLTEFSVRAIEKAAAHFPHPPQHWYISGGGGRNKYMMKRLKTLLRPGHVHKIDDLGWNGDFIEAEGFAYLAVRAHCGLPLTLPATTGCDYPLSGGEIHPPISENIKTA